MNGTLAIDKLPKGNVWHWGALGWIAFAVAAPYYLLRMSFAKKYRAGLKERLTKFSPEKIARLKDGPFIWFHTVSVGELQAARPLIERFKHEYPSHKILVSTVTETGQNLAHRMDLVDEAIYLPLDLYPLCRRVLKWVRPACIIVLETEIWPNFIRAASDRNIPLLLVNGRISDRSFQRYRLAAGLFSPILNRFESILAQSREDSVRFVRIGASQQRVRPVGNLKFETAVPADASDERQKWRRLFGIADHEILLLAGSTFPGEEALMVRVARALIDEGQPVKLLLAPRHIERTDAVVRELEALHCPLRQRSRLNESQPVDTSNAVILLDTIGELRHVYAAADIVFLGKSIFAHGGQNPIEPAAWGKPILFGPHVQNFRDICTLFVRSDAAKTVADEADLIDACRELCRSSEARAAMGQNARHVVISNQGAIDRVMETVRAILPPTGAAS